MRRLALFVMCGLLAAGPLPAQQTAADRLRAQRDSLERIRRERDDLQQRIQSLRGRAHSLTEEVNNLVQQADATARVVRSLDTQVEAVTEEVETTTSRLVRAQDELVVKRAVLQRRLADIYKRGPLYTLEVMLSAESFGALIARYKYLHELALRDQALVKRVRQLNDQIVRQRKSLVTLQSDVLATREERALEERRYRELRQERLTSLRGVARDTTQAGRRLEAIARDEAKLNDVIVRLEAERRRGAVGMPAPAARGSSGFRSGANLEWPVEGTVIYPFGRVAGPDRTVTSWNGVGIGAPEGTPVRAVAAGVVKLAEQQFSAYGPTVIIQHPSGEYTIYSSLAIISVAKDAIVDRGQQIGTVGVNDSRLPPHLHFEIRANGGEMPIDPLLVLRPRR